MKHCLFNNLVLIKPIQTVFRCHEPLSSAFTYSHVAIWYIVWSVTFRGVCETVDWFDHGDRRPTLSFCIGYAQSSTHGYVQKYLCMSQRKYHRLCLLLLQTQNVVVVGTPRWQWVPLIPPMGSVRTPIWASKYLKTPKTFAGCTSFLLTYPS